MPGSALLRTGSHGLSVTPLRKPRHCRRYYVPTAIQQQIPHKTATSTSWTPESSTVSSSTSTSSLPSPSKSAEAIAAAQAVHAPKWLLAYLKSNKERVDAALEACLPFGDSNIQTIIDSMRYSLLAGGKRIRPSLAIAAYEMFAGSGADLAPVMPSALAVEMLHTMSLIHDDLPSMDNDDFRRGKPTNHKVFGEDVAILAGDALLAYAFEFVARHTHNVEPSRVLKCIALLSESVGSLGLVGGQIMDLENEGKPDVSLDTLMTIHLRKTAVLLRVSCACGAILGGASDEDVERVSEFAVKTGLAFQIADDVLDVTQSTEVLGKTAGKDEAVEKATYPRLLGLEGSRKQAETLITEAKESLAPYGDRSETLFALADFIINRQN